VNTSELGAKCVNPTASTGCRDGDVRESETPAMGTLICQPEAFEKLTELLVVVEIEPVVLAWDEIAQYIRTTTFTRDAAYLFVASKHL